MHGLTCYTSSPCTNLLRAATTPFDEATRHRSQGRYCTDVKGDCYALGLFDSHYFAGGGYFNFYHPESRSRDNVFSGIQHPRAARDPDCGRVRCRSYNGRQLVCAIASILQRLATQSLALEISWGSVAGADRGLCNNVISRAPPGYGMTVPSVT